MRKLIITCIALFSSAASLSAQTLFTFGDNKVPKDEFLKVYQKNSMNKQTDFSEKALREYLDLYALFRMKVKEAKLQQVDTIPSIHYELNNYRKQLAKNYLTDEAMNEKLMKEAYERMKEEVHVAHILLYNSQFGASADTTAAYAKIDSIYNAIVKGKADFGAMAAKYSDDGGTKNNGGDVGYFTALQTVYPFENTAYATPVGKVSKPFRTQFGYHILKVIDRRPTMGQIQVAQILINAPKSKGEEGIAAAKRRMDTVISNLKKGAKFEDMVEKYSDDKFSNKEGGLLNPFGAGDMDAAFEKAAFSLKSPGDFSGPVQTDYGIHLIKLIKKTPIKPYDTLRNLLKRKVETDSRSQVAKQMFFDKIKQQNGFKEYPANYLELLERLNKLPDTGKNANTFGENQFGDMYKPLFDFAGKDFRQNDFMAFGYTLTRGRLMGPKAAVMKDMYNLFINNILNDFEEHRLEKDNPEFKASMNEYSDGIMLFELMDRNVWRKASVDTAGLKAFYETKKNKYQWEPGFKGSVYIFKTEAAMNEGKKMMAKKGNTDEDMVKKLNTEANPDALTIQRGRYEFSKYKDYTQAEIVKGKPTEAKKKEDGTYIIVRADEVYNNNEVKSLDEARGYIVAEYQDYLEKSWHETLQKKYPVKVDEAVFKSMVK